jgi:hypothetical protein
MIPRESTLVCSRPHHFEDDAYVRYTTIAFATAAYCLASLLHFGHNAVFLDAYPNLPSSITVISIWSVWLAITSIGIAGLLLVRANRIVPGLMVIGVYACFGFDGLAHYTVASMSSHTWGMNATIWLEALTAGVLLAAIARRLVSIRFGRKAY